MQQIKGRKKIVPKKTIRLKKNRPERYDAEVAEELMIREFDRQKEMEVVKQEVKKRIIIEAPDSIDLNVPNINVNVDMPETVLLEVDTDVEFPEIPIVLETPEHIDLRVPTTISVEVEVEFEEGKKIRVGATQEMNDIGDIQAHQEELYGTLLESLDNLIEQSS